MGGLFALTGTAFAQNNQPAAAPPPVNVEAPDKPATPPVVEAPTPNIEAPNAATPGDQGEPKFKWSHRQSRHRGHTNDRVVIGGNATLEQGQRADDVVSVMGSSTSAGDSKDVVSVLGDTRVTGSASDVVAVLGNVYLNGKATGDVVATFGSVELGPQAEVNGDVVVVGGTLKRDPASIIHGSVQNVLSFASGSFDWLRPWAQHCLLLGRPLAIASGLGWAWGVAFGFLALYVLIAVLFRGTVDRCVQTFEQQPGRSIVAALLTTLLTPVMFALLFITVIGIAFVPIAALGLFLIGLFGKAVMLAWIGRSCLRLTGEGSQPHTALAVLFGGVVVTVLYLVPFVGFLVWKALGILGLGVAVYALIQNTKKRGDIGPTPATAGAPAGGGGGAAFTDAVGEPHVSRAEPYVSQTTSVAQTSDAPQASGGSWTSDSLGASGPSDTSASSSSTGPSGTSYSSGPSGSSSSSYTSSTSQPPRPPPIEPVNSAALTYPRAGFGVRMAALFIDVILVAVLLGIVDSTKEAELIALATYGAVMWKLKSTTIGGIVFGLQVIRVDGRPIDWATATVRALSCFLSLVVAGLGFIWIAFDEGHQAWHDKIAGTAVVRVPKGVSLL